MGDGVWLVGGGEGVGAVIESTRDLGMASLSWTPASIYLK